MCVCACCSFERRTKDENVKQRMRGNEKMGREKGKGGGVSWSEEENVKETQRKKENCGCVGEWGVSLRGERESLLCPLRRSPLRNAPEAQVRRERERERRR